MAAQKLKERKPYQKPQVERVRLVVDEAVLAACKQFGTTQPGFANCASTPFFCRVAGS